MEYQVRSKSNPREFHTVKKTNLAGNFFCDCVASLQGKVCRHIRKIQNMENKTEKKLNERLVRFSGSVPIETADAVLCEEAEKLDKDVRAEIFGGVVKVETKTNFDGTYDIIYTVKPITARIFHED